MRVRFLTLAAALLAGTLGAAAQPVPSFAWGHACALEAEHVNHRTRVLPPHRGGLLPPLRGDAPLRAPAVFQVEYVDVPLEAQAAFGAAVELWAGHVSSPVPIRVRVVWGPLEENVLASASPRLIANFAAALDPDTFYPVALANALQGADLDTANPHIEATFNATFGRWYFGTDGSPPDDRFDFVTVALHEIAHGLGFIGSMQVTDGVGRWGLGAGGFPIVYDRSAVTDAAGGTFSLLDAARFPNPSRPLADALQSERVYFDGPTAARAQAESQAAQGLPVGPGARPVLHAPATWRPGSSYNHLTEQQEGGEELYYPPGSLNSLMTPRLGSNEVIRTPGPVTCGVFRDLGWPLGDGCLALLDEEPVDLEEPLLVAGPCPNPVRGGGTRIGVYVPEPSRARVDLFDLAGRRVRTVFDGRVAAVQPTLAHGRAACPSGPAGSVEVPTEGLASGVYLVRVQTRGVSRAVRLTVIR